MSQVVSRHCKQKYCLLVISDLEAVPIKNLPQLNLFGYQQSDRLPKNCNYLYSETFFCKIY